jgi:hypothetical protein
MDEDKQRNHVSQFSRAGGPIQTLGNAMEEETTEENQLPTKWTKGMASPNPAGRPKQPKTVAEVRAIAREHTVGAITTLVNVHKNKKAPPAARVAAATAILDRGWGKATGDLETAEGLVIQVVKFTQIEEPAAHVSKRCARWDAIQDWSLTTPWPTVSKPLDCRSP